MKTFVKYLAISLALINLISCKNESEEDEPIVQLNEIETFTYSSNELNLLSGNSSSSSEPNLSPQADYSFSIESTPFTEEITISNTGVLNFSSSLNTGTYIIDVLVKDEASTKRFSDAFTLIVSENATAPFGLSYSPDSVFVNNGDSFSSQKPTILGTSPFTYSITVNPTTPEISINSEGIISSTDNLTIGNYKISVEVTNQAESVIFNEALTIENNISKTTFTDDVFPIINLNCGGCHPSYRNYSSASSAANSILNRIERNPGSPGFMPRGGNALPSEDIEAIRNWISDGLIE